jgi:hypothetical protein
LVYDRSNKEVVEITLQNSGFDSVQLIPLSVESIVGGNQIVVFDPHTVAVIDDN